MTKTFIMATTGMEMRTIFNIVLYRGVRDKERESDG